MERIRGCFTAWKCLVACLFLEESQQPTWPHIRQRRRCTQRSPIATHSGQTWVVVVVIFTSSRCVHCFDILFSRHRLPYGRGSVWRSKIARSHLAKSAA